MSELTVDKEPIPYDESNFIINGFTISHEGETKEVYGIKSQEFVRDAMGRLWDIEILADVSGVIVSVEVNTDQVLEGSAEYETHSFHGTSKFCQWLESGDFELTE